MPAKTISQSETANKSDANRFDSGQTQASRSEMVQSIERDGRICGSGDARRGSQVPHPPQAEAAVRLLLKQSKDAERWGAVPLVELQPVEREPVQPNLRRALKLPRPRQATRR